MPDYRLLRRFPELLGMLVDSLEARESAHSDDAHLTDAFLAAAGLSQMCEDWVQRELLSLSRVRRHLPQAMPLRSVAASAIGATESSGARLRSLRPTERLLFEWRERIAALAMSLGRQVSSVVLGGTGIDDRGRHTGTGAAAAGERPDELAGAARWLGAGADRLPSGLLDDVVRPPNCFRSFDQRPVDSWVLVEEVARRWPERSRPLVVLGLRTSGSYLAPLTAAFLESSGYSRVSVATMRPGQRRDARLGAGLARAAAEDGLVLVVDDPPRTGSVLGRARREVIGAGVRDDAVVAVLQVFDETGAEEWIAAPSAVTLPWERWEIARLLGPDAVGGLVAEAVVGRPMGPGGDFVVGSVDDVRVVTPAAARRAHSRCVVEADLVEVGRGRRAHRLLLLEGAGLGYMGRDGPAVAERLEGRVPRVYGTSSGVVVREWLAPERRIQLRRSGDVPSAAVEGIAGYVAQRAQRLPTPADLSAAMAGRGPVVEEVGAMISDTFGRAALLARPPARRAAQVLLEVGGPSVIDADMSLEHFFTGDGAGMLKVNFAEAPSSRRERYCFDPVFDLSEAAAELAALGAEWGAKAVEALRRDYEQMSGESIGAERWLLYRLFHHRRAREGALARASASLGDAAPAVGDAVGRERLMAEAVQEYLGSTYLADLGVPSEGELCALDVDGVLESRWLGAPASSPRAALALRVLNRHGYRAVLATGRSLPEVKSRCRAYRLAGGVAEYGAVAYDQSRGREWTLLDADEQEVIGTLAAVLAATPGVFADGGHRFSLRVRTLVEGELRGLGPEGAAQIVDRAGAEGLVRVVHAPTQTDFVAAGVDKGRALDSLAESLGRDGVALAVGDGAEDIAMLACARRAVAPVDAADEFVAAGATRLGRPTQDAVVVAAHDLVGHRRRGCPVCGPTPETSRDARVLAAALDALGGRKREKLVASSTLALLVR